MHGLPTSWYIAELTHQATTTYDEKSIQFGKIFISTNVAKLTGAHPMKSYSLFLLGSGNLTYL